MPQACKGMEGRFHPGLGVVCACVELGVCVGQEMSEAYKGKEVSASVVEVVPLHRKLMLSVVNAEQNLELRKLHVRPACSWPSWRDREIKRGVFPGTQCMQRHVA